MKEFRKLEWKVYTPGLLKEILENSNCSNGIFFQPFKIFKNLLAQVADRAIELDDIKLNKLMIRLALYKSSDPYSKEYMGNKKVQEYLDLDEKTYEKDTIIRYTISYKNKNYSTRIITNNGVVTVSINVNCKAGVISCEVPLIDRDNRDYTLHRIIECGERRLKHYIDNQKCEDI